MPCVRILPEFARFARPSPPGFDSPSADQTDEYTASIRARLHDDCHRGMTRFIT